MQMYLIVKSQVELFIGSNKLASSERLLRHHARKGKKQPQSYVFKPVCVFTLLSQYVYKVECYTKFQMEIMVKNNILYVFENKNYQDQEVLTTRLYLHFHTRKYRIFNEGRYYYDTCIFSSSQAIRIQRYHLIILNFIYKLFFL